MAGSSVIGSLRVDLGLNAASFETGLKKASESLNKFGVQLTLSVETIANGLGRAIGSLPNALGKAIDRFDELSKASQRAGVAVEALSKLEYAAKLADVSFEQLTGGLQRLSRGMAEVSTGGAGPAATAFAALGIKVTDAAGALKSSAEVFLEIADRFARLEDGTQKTALAIQLFGRAGAQMIPLLNEGREGLKAAGDEAERFGRVVGQDAAENAELFNDNMTRVQEGLGGIVDRIATAALPVLSYLSKAFVELAGNGQLVQAFAEGFVFVLKSVVSVAAVTVTAIGAITDSLLTLLNAMRVVQTQGFDAAIAVLSAGGASIRENIGATIEFINGLWTAVSPDGASTPLTPFVADMDAFANSADAAKARAKELKDELADIKAIVEGTRTPFEQMQVDIEKLGKLFDEKKITAEQFGRAVGDAMANAASSTLGALANLASGLSQAFEDNKALAIATAVLKGAEAVASAFAAGNAIGGPVVGAAFAAAAAVTAAANVAAVASTSQSSTSMTGSAAASTPAAAVPTPAQPGINLELRGSPNDRASLSDVKSLFDQLSEELGVNGLQIVTTYRGA